MKRTIPTSVIAATAAAGLTLAVSPAAAAAPTGSPPSGAHTPSAVAAADSHVTSHTNLTHLSSDGNLIRTDVVKGANGMRHVQYRRTYQGIPVVGGDVVITTDANGDVVDTSVAQGKTIDISTDPAVNAQNAKSTARGQVDSVEKTSKPRLVVLTWNGQPQLAWETVVHGTTDGLPTKLHVFVNASSGEVAGSYDEVKAGTGHGYYVGDVNIGTSSSGSRYVMKDSSRPGIQCGGQNGSAYTSPDDDWGNGTGTDLETACVDALYAVQAEWDMLGDWLGRSGIDGNGGGFAARVGLDAVNAYWNGSYVSFGHSADGRRQATGMDVVGHEFGHAIFQYTPGGTGYGVDNGLNEGTGDIFGALTEAYADNPNDPADYTVGEEVNLGGTGPIRVMYDPGQVNQPGCYDSSIPNTEVHSAAGPLDHWFYLLAEGSNPTDGHPQSPTCDNSTVQGIGIKQAGKIYYNAMLQKTSTWSYLDVRADTLSAAKNLYQGCTVFNKVKAAWNAVSVPAQRNEPTCGGGNGDGDGDGDGDGGPNPPQTTCTDYNHVFSGSVAPRRASYEPNGSYFYSPAGSHSACLDGPDGTDLDLRLLKWTGYGWTPVAASTTPSADEQLTYSGQAGIYTYQVRAASGSGNYTLGFDAP